MLEGLIGIVFGMLIKEFSAIQPIHLNDAERVNDNNIKIIKNMKNLLSVVSICSAVGATLLSLVCNSLETTLVSVGLMWTAIASTKAIAEYDRK